MKYLVFVLLLTSASISQAQKNDNRFFELRTYHCESGKRPDLIKRFENHTMRLFEKHGIKNIAYFLPVDSSDNTLVFILAYPRAELRDSMWNSFAGDPEWQKVARESEANGTLVKKVDQVFMNVVPELTGSIRKGRKKGERVFELRTYHCFPEKLDDLIKRFDDHTMKLFEKHGMKNVVYWQSVEKTGNDSKLVYLLAHKSHDAGKASFAAFGKDPDWVKVRDASEANGKIVEKVVSKYLVPLPFSPLK